MAMFFPMIPEAIPAQAAAEIGRVPPLIWRRAGSCWWMENWWSARDRRRCGSGSSWPCGSSRTGCPSTGTSGEKRYGIDRGVLETKLPSGYAEAELERSVRETASFCPAVRAVRDLAISRQGRACLVEFTAVLHTGETVEVSVDV